MRRPKPKPMQVSVKGSRSIYEDGALRTAVLFVALFIGMLLALLVYNAADTHSSAKTPTPAYIPTSTATPIPTRILTPTPTFVAEETDSLYGKVYVIDPTYFDPTSGNKIDCGPDGCIPAVCPDYYISQPPEFQPGTIWILWKIDKETGKAMELGVWKTDRNSYGCAIVMQEDKIRLDLCGVTIPREDIYGIAILPPDVMPEPDSKYEARMKAWNNICGSYIK